MSRKNDMIGIHGINEMSAMPDISKTKLYYSLYMSEFNGISRMKRSKAIKN